MAQDVFLTSLALVNMVLLVTFKVRGFNLFINLTLSLALHGLAITLRTNEVVGSQNLVGNLVFGLVLTPFIWGANFLIAFPAFYLAGYIREKKFSLRVLIAMVLLLSIYLYATLLVLKIIHK